MKSLLALVIVVLAGCPASRPSISTTPTRPDGPPPKQVPPAPGQPKVAWDKVKSPDDVPSTPPAEGAFRIHMIDVGTGLAILVQGHDFNMLFDGGSGDASEKPLRVVSYLAKALGPSGDESCVAKGEAAPNTRVKLDHVVLSHPHMDHGSALDLVVHCFDVGQIWDSGAINETVFYRDFLEEVAKSSASYHTAADVPSDRTVNVKGASITIKNWSRFSESDEIRLGESAKATILHAEGKKKDDFNENSIVLAVELGATRLLLTGDAESGPRKDPSEEPGDIEEFLLDHHKESLRADILQVGHHGSKTSSRRVFLDAIKPKLALVSAGPKKYATVVLPDAEVIEALRAVGAQVLRTDEHDGGCPIPRRIGPDTGPGGCDTFIITITPPT